MFKTKFEELMNSIAEKVISMMVAKVTGGNLDSFLQAKVDSIVEELIEP